MHYRFNPRVAFHYYAGVSSLRKAVNPFCRNSQILQFHAWQAGHYDKYGKLAKGYNE
jgi:hypothetical protein